jgi:hypothetical protein
MVVSYKGRQLPAEITVAEAGIPPFQSIFVNWAETEGTS